MEELLKECHFLELVEGQAFGEQSQLVGGIGQAAAGSLRLTEEIFRVTYYTNIDRKTRGKRLCWSVPGGGKGGLGRDIESVTPHR